jgi:hypothetical protein
MSWVEFCRKRIQLWFIAPIPSRKKRSCVWWGREKCPQVAKYRVGYGENQVGEKKRIKKSRRFFSRFPPAIYFFEKEGDDNSMRRWRRWQEEMAAAGTIDGLGFQNWVWTWWYVWRFMRQQTCGILGFRVRDKISVMWVFEFFDGLCRTHIEEIGM